MAADFGIREEYFENISKPIPEDDSTGIIVLHPEKCIKCGRCLEVCQNIQNVWALSFLHRGIKTKFGPAGAGKSENVSLYDSPCIRCGQCAEHCPVGAIFVQDNTSKAWEILRDKTKHVVVQIAPAVRAAIGESFNFPQGTNLTKKVYAALRQLGFDKVFDTNFGADVTIMEEGSEFVERFVHGKGALPLITTCCPSWVDFMEKRHYDMIEHFSSCKSPNQIVGVLAKTYYAEKHNIKPENISVISIMPCTAKKYEITRSEEMYASGHQDVDVVLTTRELARMIKQSGIDFESLADEEADLLLGEYAGAGTIFGTTGGVMEAALRTAAFVISGKPLENVEFKDVRGLKGVKETSIDINGIQVRIAVAHGLGNVEFILEKVRKAKEKGEELPYHFIEVMACTGGCIGGGGQPYGINDKIREARMKCLYQDDIDAKVRSSHENPMVIKLYEEFLEKPLSEKSEKLLHTKYKSRPIYKR
jgi:NADH-quinone oxidoreductase subunit G